MNREELDALVYTTIRDSGTASVFEASQLTTELVSELWSVLAQVWDEGYEGGSHDVHALGDWDMTDNPYKETAS